MIYKGKEKEAVRARFAFFFLPGSLWVSPVEPAMQAGEKVGKE